MKTSAACLTMILISHATVALAQGGRLGNTFPSTTTGYGVPARQYNFGAPVAGHVHHASTCTESARRGAAAMIQAQGQYNLLTSLAMLNVTEAQRRQFELWQQVRVIQQQQAAINAAKYQAYRDRLAEKREARRRQIREQMLARQ
jgi:hypothetical protein